MEGRKMKEAEKLGMVGTMVECKGKLLAGLTVGLMVPLCVADMAQSFITKPMEARISWDVYLLRRTPSRSESAARIESDMHHEMAKLYAFHAAYLFFSPPPPSSTSDTTTTSYQKILFTIFPASRNASFKKKKTPLSKKQTTVALSSTYSTSVDDSATAVCFFDLQAIAPPAKV